MQGRGEPLIRNPCHKYLAVVVFDIRNRIDLLRLKLQHGLGIGFVWDGNLASVEYCPVPESPTDRGSPSRSPEWHLSRGRVQPKGRSARVG